MKKEALVLFAKSPQLGKVKTRLSAEMGNDKALAIYEKLLDLNCDLCSNLAVHKFIFWDQLPESRLDHLKQDFEFSLQKGSDLGEKMKNAFQFLLQSGFEKVVLIGTDCPYLSVEGLKNALKKLKEQEVVLGPAEDGGYYLIGLTALHPELFDNIAWSTPAVLKQTLKKINAKGMSFSLLPTLSDIDTAKDYKKWSSTFTS